MRNRNEEGGTHMKSVIAPFGRFSLLIPVMVLLSGVGLYAQGAGSMSGTVADPTGAVVPSATVFVTNLDTDATQTINTDASGHFQLARLPIGNYRVEVKATGFKTSGVRNLTLHLDENLRVDVQLQLGDAMQTVEVTAAAPLTETSSAEIGNVIQENRVREL